MLLADLEGMTQRTYSFRLPKYSLSGLSQRVFVNSCHQNHLRGVLLSVLHIEIPVSLDLIFKITIWFQGPPVLRNVKEMLHKLWKAWPPLHMSYSACHAATVGEVSGAGSSKWAIESGKTGRDRKAARDLKQGVLGGTLTLAVQKKWSWNCSLLERTFQKNATMCKGSWEKASVKYCV